VPDDLVAAWNTRAEKLRSGELKLTGGGAVTISPQPNGKTNVYGDVNQLHPEWRRSVVHEISLHRLRTTATRIVTPIGHIRPRVRGGGGRPGVRRVVSRSAGGGSSGEDDEPEPAKGRQLDVTEYERSCSGHVEGIANAVGMRSAGAIVDEFLTFAAFHRATPGLSGPARMQLFFELPARARRACWDDLRDRLDRTHNGELV
jgi:hypothetical protein